MFNLRSFFKKNLGTMFFVVQIILCFFLLANAEASFSKKFKEGGHTFFSFFQMGMSGVTSVFATPIRSIGELNRLKEENEKLKAILSDYQLIKNENIELKEENRKLEDQLDYHGEMNSVYNRDIKQILARVIAKQPGNFYDSFIIDKGEKDGLETGMPVVAQYENFQGLTGKIITLGKSTSIVMPIYNDKFFAAARFRSSYYEGLINGRGEGSQNLLMSYVNKQAKSEIKVGDLVITSGLGEVFPQGIHIGNVQKISSKTYENSMDIELEPVVDFSRLEYVFVLAVDDDRQEDIDAAD